MPAYLPTLNWPIYSGWTAFTPTIPKMYWNVYSQEQRIKDLSVNYCKVEQYLDMVAEQTNSWNEMYTRVVQDALDEFENELNNEIPSHIDALMPDAITRAIKMVFFGLSEDGYFLAFIPDTWDEIQFDTGFSYTDQNTYGRLILNMEVDDTFQINGRPIIEEGN